MIWPWWVQVVTPTVAARRRARETTLEQWRALGAHPIVVEQPPTAPIGHMAQLATARAGLATDAT